MSKMHSDHPLFDGFILGLLDGLEMQIESAGMCPRCTIGALTMTMIARRTCDGDLNVADLDHMVECVHDIRASLIPAEKLN